MMTEWMIREAKRASFIFFWPALVGQRLEGHYFPQSLLLDFVLSLS